MIDKKTESDIKAIKGFLEFWVKFHSIKIRSMLPEMESDEALNRANGTCLIGFM